MYSRIDKLRKKNLILFVLSMILVCSVLSVVLFNSKHQKVADNFTTRAKAEVIEKSSEKSSSKEKNKEDITNSSSEMEITTDMSSTVEQAMEDTTQLEVKVGTAQQSVVTTSTPVTSDTAIYNGNTAGEVGASAAAQMAAATGVSQTVWEQIIARESNGNPYVSNGSGASGLFQTMPGWGSTATVQDQINSAINAYNAQGLSAWGY